MAKQMVAEEYLTIAQLADRLQLSPKSIRNKMANRNFRRGVHYFSPRGLRPRFKWSAIVEWLEEKEEQTTQEVNDSIPMARGYFLGESSTEKNLP